MIVCYQRRELQMCDPRENREVVGFRIQCKTTFEHLILRQPYAWIKLFCGKDEEGKVLFLPKGGIRKNTPGMCAARRLNQVVEGPPISGKLLEVLAAVEKKNQGIRDVRHPNVLNEITGDKMRGLVKDVACDYLDSSKVTFRAFYHQGNKQMAQRYGSTPSRYGAEGVAETPALGGCEVKGDFKQLQG